MCEYYRVTLVDFNILRVMTGLLCWYITIIYTAHIPGPLFIDFDWNL